MTLSFYVLDTTYQNLNKKYAPSQVLQAICPRGSGSEMMLAENVRNRT